MARIAGKSVGGTTDPLLTAATLKTALSEFGGNLRLLLQKLSLTEDRIRSGSDLNYKRLLNAGSVLFTVRVQGGLSRQEAHAAKRLWEYLDHQVDLAWRAFQSEEEIRKILEEYCNSK
jgi:hypothetical protein